MSLFIKELEYSERPRQRQWAPDEEEVDLSLDANLPGGEEEEEEQVSVGLGRERR